MGRLKEAMDCKKQFDASVVGDKAKVAIAKTGSLTERVAAKQVAAAASRGAGATESGGACTPVSLDRQ